MKKKIKVSLEEEIYHKLKKETKSRGIPTSTYVSKLIKAVIEK